MSKTSVRFLLPDWLFKNNVGILPSMEWNNGWENDPSLGERKCRRWIGRRFLPWWQKTATKRFRLKSIMNFVMSIERRKKGYPSVKRLLSVKRQHSPAMNWQRSSIFWTATGIVRRLRSKHKKTPKLMLLMSFGVFLLLIMRSVHSQWTDQLAREVRSWLMSKSPAYNATDNNNNSTKGPPI